MHERDLNSDFLLIILRDVLSERPDLRVVTMSATVNARLFADYFSQVRSELTPRGVSSIQTQPKRWQLIS